MIVALARIELRIPAHSLKEKRRVVRSIVDKVKARFDVRLAEVDGQDTWQRAVLGCAVVGGDRVVAERVVAKVVDYVHGAGEVVADDRELVTFGDELRFGGGPA